MEIQPPSLEFINDELEEFYGFGTFHSNQFGFLGDLTLASTVDKFWQLQQNANIKLLIMNTSDSRLVDLLMSKIDSKPSEIQIIWFFFNQKLLRSTLRKITKFQLQFLSLPKCWFTDEAGLLERKFSRLGVADFLPPSVSPEVDHDVIEFLSII